MKDRGNYNLCFSFDIMVVGRGDYWINVQVITEIGNVVVSLRILWEWWFIEDSKELYNVATDAFE